MKLLLVLFVIFLVASCGAGDSNSGTLSSSTLETTLSNNTTWPYQVEGILEIVDAGDLGDSGYTTWAAGSLITVGDENGVAISVEEKALADGKIDIDSGAKVRVWLDAPSTEFGGNTYPIAKIEKL